MGTARLGFKVKVSYSILLNGGTRLDPSDSSDTLEFVLGRDAVIPGFEQAILGMATGELKQITVPEAFGPRKPEKIVTVQPSAVHPKVGSLSVGDFVRVVSAEEGDCCAVVHGLTPSGILLDTNHPLSGQDVTFEIRVLAVADRDEAGRRSKTAFRRSALSSIGTSHN